MIIKKLLLTIIIMLPGFATVDPARVATCDNDRDAMRQGGDVIVMRKAAGQ